MIRYDLVCDRTHEFEGWFRDSAAFAEQISRDLIACPECGRTAIRQALAMPAVNTTRSSRGAAASEQSAVAAPTPVTADRMRMALRQLRTAIERDCDDVGDGFADEAIRMAQGEIPERGIYGQATAQDRERLDDAGVEVMSIPWVPRDDG